MKWPPLIDNIVNEVLELLDPYQNFNRMIKVYHNSLEVQGKTFEIKNKLHIFATGKAASFEADAFLKILDNSPLINHLEQVVSYTKHGHTVNNDRIEQLTGSHPVLTEENINKTRIFLKKLQNIHKDDTVVFLLSGGASALLELPNPDLDFLKLQRIHKSLLSSGKGINEMNRERKRLSQVKNGKLLNFIPTRRIIQFITCDIPNEKLEDVSSGPLLSFSNKESHPYTIKSQSASKLIENLGHISNMIPGKIYDCSLTELMDDLEHHLPQKNSIVISGGEAPIKLPSFHGEGGRNTHFVLAFAHKIYTNEKNRNIHIMSLGTDGGDGPTDAAGAYLNYDLYTKLSAEKYLKDFNSYHYFDKLGTLIKTGPTKTNVMDIRFLWRE